MTDMEIFEASQILINEHRQLVTENCGGFPALRILIVDADGKSRVPTYGTPVNAVAASKVLTVGGTPAEGDTVSIGGIVYRARRDALGAGVAASKILTLNSNPLEGDTITIGSKTYKIRRDALGAGVAASAILTNDQTAPADGETITVGTTVYRFKDIPAQANDIAISTASVTTLRLFKAMAGTGIEGSDYFAGTVALAGATVVHTSEFVITITLTAVGFAGNTTAKASTAAHYDWDGETAFFTGGIDAQAENDVYAPASGTSATIDNLLVAINDGATAGVVGTGTTANEDAVATKESTSELKVEYPEIGTDGNDIDLGETLDDALSVWASGAVKMSGGVNPEEANDIYCTNAVSFIDNLVLAVTAGAGEGTNYGTGTVINPLATAVKASASTMTATNKIKGVVGNDTVIAKNGTNLSWAGGATKLSGGVDGTIGYFGQKMADADYEYECYAPNTIADANWKREAHTKVAY